MKRSTLRVTLPLLVALLLVAAGLLLLVDKAAHAEDPAKWLPQETILYGQMPDLLRTARRWPGSDLGQIIAEPEVQAFLQKPLASLAQHTDADGWEDAVRRIIPRQCFVAVPEWTGDAPAVVAGISFSGRSADVEALLDQLRKTALAAWPDGKSDIQKDADGEIETFTASGFTETTAIRGHWVFLSTDVAALKSLLDRFAGHGDPVTLAASAAFQGSIQHLPAEPDSLVFVRPGIFANKASALTLMLNPAADAPGAASPDLKKIETAAMAWKIDGPLMREALFLSEPGKGDEPPLARDILRISSTDTILAYASQSSGLGGLAQVDPKSDPFGLAPIIDSAIAQQGLGAQAFEKAFGPECGFVVDWPAASMIPTPLLLLDVRDPALARKYLDAVAAAAVSMGIAITHADAGGISLYTGPASGFGIFPLQLTIGLTGHCVIGSLDLDPVKLAAARWDANGNGLAASEDYQKVAGMVAAPTQSFTYVDLKNGFERVYGLFRGIASLGFVPHLSDYVDIAKLPSAAAISRHLSPAVSSTSPVSGGVLMESVGPVTTSQAGSVMLAAAVGLAAPYIESQFQGQNVTLPNIPGFSPGAMGGGRGAGGNPTGQGASAITPAPAPVGPGAGASASGTTP